MWPASSENGACRDSKIVRRSTATARPKVVGAGEAGVQFTRAGPDHSELSGQGRSNGYISGLNSGLNIGLLYG